MITNGVASEYNYIMEKPMPQFGKDIYSTIRIPDDVVAQIRADAIEEILSWMDNNCWVEKELLEYLEQLKEQK